MEERSGKRTALLFAFGVLWLLEGAPFLLFEGLPDRLFALWTAVFLLSHPLMIRKVMADGSPQTKTGIYTAIVLLNVVSSGISCFLYITHGTFWGIVPALIKLFLLWTLRAVSRPG